MNIVESGSRLQVYGEEVQTYKTLPIGSYDVNFNKMTGFYLSKRHDLIVSEDKIYGNHEEKVNKVMRSFEVTGRNFGIILSGQKGIGKSLFARILATKSLAAGYPIINVANYVPGIADFLSSIEQEVVVIFDEFEKTFAESDNYDPQEEMLSLFDGIDAGKKLFVVTCNEVSKLNSYLVNRPGRFHYHFVISNPTPEEVREYLSDKLLPQYHEVIERVVNFSRTINITYDYLRAIVFELNQSYSIEETLQDLNITRTSDIRFTITAITAGNKEYTAYGERIDLYSQKAQGVRLYCGKDSIWITFVPTQIKAIDGQLQIDPTGIEPYIDRDDFWDEDDDIWNKKYKEAVASHKLKSIIVTKNAYSLNERYLV